MNSIKVVYITSNVHYSEITKYNVFLIQKLVSILFSFVGFSFLGLIHI